MQEEILLIIDPQKDFINHQADYANRHGGIKQILEAKENINQLIQSGDVKNIVVVYSNYEANQFGENISMCIEGTEGHKIDILLNENCVCIAKTKHSCFSSLSFVNYLEKHNVKRVIIAGFLAEYCVKETAFDALSKKYAVCILEDCIGTADDVQHRKLDLITNLKNANCEILNWHNFINV
jgi:nicotinamidase/pyrazinamidase